MNISFTNVRYDCIKLAHVGPDWRYVDAEALPQIRVVGPVYKSKTEALADLERYYHAAWAGRAERDAYFA